MTKAIVSRTTAKVYSFILFLIGLAIITYFREWWPSILLVTGIPLALRQYLLGKRYDTWITLIVFVGVFISVQFNPFGAIFIPVLFTIGGLYIFFRDFFEKTTLSEDLLEEDINEEIEEKQHKK